MNNVTTATITGSLILSAFLAASMAKADINSDPSYSAASKPVAGRNARINLALSTAIIKAALLQARKKGEANRYKTAPTAFIKCNPGEVTINEVKVAINKAWKGAQAKVIKISAGKYMGKFEYKGRLIKIYIVENGKGHA